MIDKLNYSTKLKNLINVPSLSQLSRKNGNRDYSFFEDLYYSMISLTKRDLGIKALNKNFKDIKAFDSTVITITSSLASGLHYENRLAGIKVSTLLNLSGDLPEKIRFLTNIFDIPAGEIMELYRLRWKVELFFKWIKQNLKIKKWLEYNENAIKIQIYSALISSIILALLKVKLKTKVSMISISRRIELNLLEESTSLNLLSG